MLLFFLFSCVCNQVTVPNMIIVVVIVVIFFGYWCCWPLLASVGRRWIFDAHATGLQLRLIFAVATGVADDGGGSDDVSCLLLSLMVML